MYKQGIYIYTCIHNINTKQTTVWSVTTTATYTFLRGSTKTIEILKRSSSHEIRCCHKLNDSITSTQNTRLVSISSPYDDIR